jgi:hypothetical protein
MIKTYKILFVLLVAFSFKSFADNNETTDLSKLLCAKQDNKNCSTNKHCLNAVKNHLYTCMEKAVKNKVDTENMTAYYRYLEACSLKEQSKVSNVKITANENCS